MREEASMKRKAACFAVAGTMFLSIFAATAPISAGAEVTPDGTEASVTMPESQKADVSGTEVQEQEPKQAENQTDDADDAISLKAPQHVKAKAQELDVIELQWNKVNGAEGYEVFRSVEKKGAYQKIATIKNWKKTNYKDKDCVIGQKYYYRIRAYANETYGPYSKRVVEKAAPAKTTVKLQAGEEKIKISWKKAENAQGYHIYRAESKDGDYVRIVKLKGGDVTTFTNLNLKGGKKYYYKVRGYHWTKGKKVYARYSDVVSAKAKKPKLKTHKKGFQYKDKFVVKAYAYTGGGTTASGTPARVGAIAVSPNVIPLGTEVYVEGYGFAKAEDTGGNIKGRTVDLYFNSVGACYKWGVRHKTIYTGVRK